MRITGEGIWDWAQSGGRGISLNPAPYLALPGEVWFTELGCKIAFLGQNDAEMQDDGERYDK